MASIKLNNYEIFSQSGDTAPKLNNSTGLNFSTTHQNFTIKGIDAPIVGATNSTEDNPNSGQLAIYNGDTKLWGINESGWVQNPKNPMCMLFDFGNTALTANVAAYPFNGIVIDTNNNYDISDVNNPKFFAPVDGYYRVSANSRFYYDYNGRAACNVLVNGNSRVVMYFNYFAGAASQEFQEASGNAIVKMSAGDYLQIVVIADVSTNHLGWGAPSYTVGETDSIGNSASHANIFLIG